MARNQEYLDKFRKQVWGASVAEQGLPKWRANPAAILRWCMLNALVIVGCLVIGLLAMANEWNRQAAEEANLLLATQVIIDATQTAIIALTPTDTPTITPSSTPTPRPTRTPRSTPDTETWYVTAPRRVDIRDCASTDCEIIGRVNSGDALQVVETVSGWRTLRLTDGQTGYIAASLTSRMRPDSGSDSTDGFPAFCDLPCPQLTCEQAYQCGGHPARDRDQDGMACESQCWN